MFLAYGGIYRTFLIIGLLVLVHSANIIADMAHITVKLAKYLEVHGAQILIILAIFCGPFNKLRSNKFKVFYTVGTGLNGIVPQILGLGTRVYHVPYLLMAKAV